jgi:hypothetical protein
MHSQAFELFATFWIVKIYLFPGSFKKFPKFKTIFYVRPYLLKPTKSFKSFGLAKFLILAAHQSVSILNVFSFLVFYLGAGSINKHSPCITSLTAGGGLIIDFSYVK